MWDEEEKSEASDPTITGAVLYLVVMAEKRCVSGNISDSNDGVCCPPKPPKRPLLLPPLLLSLLLVLLLLLLTLYNDASDPITAGGSIPLILLLPSRIDAAE